MTDPTVFEQAARLCVALRKLDDRTNAALAKLREKHEARRAEVLAAYPAEVVAMVEKAEGEIDGN